MQLEDLNNDKKIPSSTTLYGERRPNSKYYREMIRR